jgi:hypothetical protein
MRGWHAPRNPSGREVDVRQPVDDEPRFGRIEELRRLERCERGLGAAYERAPAGRRNARALAALAARHRAHAELLRRRAEALGGRGADGTDEDWLARRTAGEDPLRAAERESIAIYHDHLTDFDVETEALVRGRILPDHERALADLDRGSEA